jgi:hypothetical protein
MNALVEVLGRYSNLCDQGERVRTLLEMTPDGQEQSKVRTPKQAQHRLSSGEVDELVAGYQAGTGVNDLATQFGVNRDTVFAILKRREVVRRPRGIPSDLVERAVSDYRAGLSLAVIGAELSVDPATVSRTLRKAGVSLRPRRGWHYDADESGTRAV